MWVLFWFKPILRACLVLDMQANVECTIYKEMEPIILFGIAKRITNS